MATQPSKPPAASSGHDKLEFYSLSPDVPPGQGRGEHVSNPANYTDLAKIKSWRSILSNFDMSEFEWLGYTWPSIEHAYQGAKMLVSSRDVFVAFSKEGTVQPGGRMGGMLLEQAAFGDEGAERVDEMREQAEMMQRKARTAKGRSSGAGATRGTHAVGRGATSPASAPSFSGFPHIGAETSLAARQARQLVQLSIDQAEFWRVVSKSIMLNISRAKYAQSSLSQRVLLATNAAELWHRVEVDNPLVRFDHLETIRDELAIQAVSKHVRNGRDGAGKK